jgi:hypothetical protein
MDRVTQLSKPAKPQASQKRKGGASGRGSEERNSTPALAGKKRGRDLETEKVRHVSTVSIARLHFAISCKTPPLFLPPYSTDTLAKSHHLILPAKNAIAMREQMLRRFPEREFEITSIGFSHSADDSEDEGPRPPSTTNPFSEASRGVGCCDPLFTSLYLFAVTSLLPMSLFHPYVY